jgi:hypothetical protein
MANKITCPNCGHSWDKSDSSKKDAYVCHICGKNIKNMQLGGNVYSASYVPQAEEGWLSKYKDGGSMQEHQENYNDSSVSMGPGFVGMGNNTKGRNYSPAWGGQFEDGGYIPQAQNGLEKNKDVESSAYEKEGAPSRLPSIKSTFASYINSPIYKKRLEGMNIANPDKVIKERLNKLNQVDVSVGPSPSLIYAYTKPNQKEQVPALTVKQKDSDYTMMHELSHVTNYGDTFFDPKINKYAKSNFGDVNTASGKGMSVNEMLYITDRANMSPKYKNAILAKAESNKKWGTYSNPADGSGLAGDPHAFDSSELKSDLDAIRLLFQREKLTKKFGEDIDESTIEKALKNKNISNEPHFQRMLKNFNKKNIVDLNNRIAMNDLRESSSDNMAEYGGAFAMGGSVPGSVGFTYARTQGIPSNGPYAKKTKASAQDGKEVEYKELPEIVVVGGKDKPTIDLYRKELDKLQSSENNPFFGANEYAKYYAKMQMAKEFGVPKIRPEEPIGAFKRFFRDRSGIKTDPNKPWPQYSPFSKTVYSDFDKYEKSYIPELSHYVSQTKRKEYLGKDNYLQAGLKTLLEYAKGNNPYDVEGTEENFAHQQLQPALQETYEEFIKEGRKKFTESANNAMNRKIYERNKKLQNGGEMKFYQEGLDWKPKSISKNGSVIKDDRGQWAHPGEITEISSPYITMEGVPYPVLGISDTGDTQMMYPEKDYKFKGKKVTEYPVGKKWLEKYK